MTRALILDPSRRFRAELERHLDQVGVKVFHSGHDFDRGLSLVRQQDLGMVFVGGRDEACLLRFAKDVAKVASSQPDVIAIAPGSGTSVSGAAFASHTALLLARPVSDEEFTALATRVVQFHGRRGGGVGKRRETRRRVSRFPYDAVVIVSSTGGPPALSKLLTALGRDFPLPIAMVQHLPAGFDTGLCANLERDIGRPVLVAEQGMTLDEGAVVVAPSGKHLELSASSGALSCQLRSGPPEVGCRPSGNRLLRSAAETLGSRLIGICLTGMGTDGAEGMKAVHARRGHVIAQDEATSVVYGMPAAVAAAGVANQILPLGGIAAAVKLKIHRSHHGSSIVSVA